LKTIVWISLLFPLPFALIFYYNSRNGIECAVYYVIFALILLVSLYLNNRKPKNDKQYDDYII